ncbi:tRNA (adenosine(37)-N6)-threonylcarbamoyltransferase complex dimerization subunit type 1 TsaB [Candidatus Peregrinibacteria bacterium]|nr:tRNA (adenosine(37)-N6)-threonylcarbamoyltransferase complex dimerization subunit type 1 TsaB [Candidatus Peregrinibacteria bacterium]
MFLCIDTTTSESGITLTGYGYLPLDPQYASEEIIQTIDKLIKKAGIELSQIEGVYVIKGPGSFTGLRVGIAVANQFSHQLKIPIIGLKTDEWWKNKTDEEDFVYLQTMNKSEIYMDGKIIPIENLSGDKKWIGQLSENHLSKLPSGFTQITNLLSPEETWNKVALKTISSKLKAYELVEPYYGKEPMITKSKKKLSI